MRKIDLSAVTTTVSAYFKAGTMVHLQAAYTECFNALMQLMIGGTYDPTKVYLMYGVVVSGTTATTGAAFYNGEIYIIPAATGLVNAGSQVLVLSLITSGAGAFFTDTSADPVAFSDGNTHNIHQLRPLKLSYATSGSGLVDYANVVQLPLPTLNVTTSSNEPTVVSFAKNTLNVDDLHNDYGTTATITYSFTGAVAGTKSRLYGLAAGGGTVFTIPTGTLLPFGQTGHTIIIPNAQSVFLFEFQYLGLNQDNNPIVSLAIFNA